MASKTTTRIRRDLRRKLGVLAELKGTHLHQEMNQALVCHIERPENAARLLTVRDQLDALLGERTAATPLLGLQVPKEMGGGTGNLSESEVHDAD